MSGPSKTILYSYWRSSCSWRVRVALNLKEVVYETKSVNIEKPDGELSAKEFSQINPMARVPVLRIDGRTLTESLNIMHYLEETRPEPALMPRDVERRAKVREICEIIATGIQPVQNIGILRHLDKEKRYPWAQQWITKGFVALEQILKTSASKYCVGDEITLADCCLVPQVYNARKFRVDLKPYPTISRIDRELENHPAFVAAHADKQPDVPREVPQI